MRILCRIQELRTLEARAQARLPVGTLMQRAGQAAAGHLQAWLAGRRESGVSEPARILVLCGPGDNGGDGYVCATALRRLGHRSRCWAPLPPGTALARAAADAWRAEDGEVRSEAAAACAELLDADVVVDALFGIGASRPLSGEPLAMLRAVAARGIPVFALDVPSGLDADTGAWLEGVEGARATETLTFLANKPGLHTHHGPDAAGIVTVYRLDAGMLEQAAGAPLTLPHGQLNDPELFRVLARPRERESNKGDYGSVAVVGGAPGMTGAALLAARAALRLGAGRVYVDCMDAGLVVDPVQPELMFRNESALPPVEALVAGCGMGTDARAAQRLARALEHNDALVLDADALNLLARETALASALAARDPQSATVLTPHPGEAARLLGITTEQVQADRVAAAQRLAQQARATVVLKGAGTVIADAGGRYVINPTGGPALASAGSGDVLAGMVGALLAQGYECSAAVAGAVWLHGRAAGLHGADIGLLASEIAPLAARALALLRLGALDET